MELVESQQTPASVTTLTYRLAGRATFAPVEA